MQLLAIGINHHTAPLALRERVVFPLEQLYTALPSLYRVMAPASSPTASLNEHVTANNYEAAILSTCNRTELYLALPHLGSEIQNTFITWLAQYQGISPHELMPHIYGLEQIAAARHAFRVASGLDSMVLGETQILGQLKTAIQTARHIGTVGTYLNQLFQRTFTSAKEVRTQTEIGMHSISMAAAAVRLAQRLFSNLSDQKILFIGAGEMITLSALHFGAHRPAHIAIANRNPSRSLQLSKKLSEQGLHAHTLPLTEVPQRLAEFDIVISCTASQLPIIGLGAVERAIRTRRHSPIFMMDLAVPRDIEPEVGQLDDVFLYTIDDLSAIVNEGSLLRQAAVQQAEVIIEAHVKTFMHWLDKRTIVPVIHTLKRDAAVLCAVELKRAHKRLAQGETPELVLEQLAQALTNKFLHGSMRELTHTQAAERDALLKFLPRLFRQSTHSER